MKLVQKGKVKEVYEVSDAELEFVFTDQISVFDKVIPSLVPHKGETLCRTSAYWFNVVQGLGIRTHFLRVAEGNRMRVRRGPKSLSFVHDTPVSPDPPPPLGGHAPPYRARSHHPSRSDLRR